MSDGADGEDDHRRCGQTGGQSVAGLMQQPGQVENPRRQQQVGQGQDLAGVHPCHAEPHLCLVEARRPVRHERMRPLKPSTVSRRLSVGAGFYRTCVIDGVLEHSPAEYVRRPAVPPESPTLGLTHLQFEAMLTAARESDSSFDFALVCLLGLLGLRIFETVGADINDLGEEHGHRVLRVRAREARSPSCRCHRGEPGGRPRRGGTPR